MRYTNKSDGQQGRSDRRKAAAGKRVRSTNNQENGVDIGPWRIADRDGVLVVHNVETGQQIPLAGN